MQEAALEQCTLSHESAFLKTNRESHWHWHSGLIPGNFQNVFIQARRYERGRPELKEKQRCFLRDEFILTSSLVSPCVANTRPRRSVS